jgi:hypothetical protein
MPRNTLKYTPEYDFELIAIACSSNIYQLVWAMNNLLQLDFTADDNLTIYHPKLSAPQLFEVFSSITTDELIVIRLIANKSNNGFLVEELKNIDFFIHVSGEGSSDFMKLLVPKFKQSSIIQGVYSIDLDSLASKQKLIF